MLTQLRFQNFKVLRDVTVDLEPFTVLVGPNACGKSSVLDGAEMLLARPRLDTDAAKRLCTFGATSLSLSLVADGTEHQARLNPASEGSRNPEPWTADASALEGAPKPVRLSLLAGRLGAPAHSDQATPSLAADGRGLAPVLADLAANEPEVLEAIREALAEVVPGVGRIRLPRHRLSVDYTEEIRIDDQVMRRPRTQPVWGHRLELQMNGSEFVSADLLSEGTLITLGVITAVQTAESPALILFDDIGRALHPRAQGALIQTLRRLQAAQPDVQLVCTTHSPYLLDHFEPAEVRVMRLGADGHALCDRLDAHPDFERWRDFMTAGEFWSTVGEGWLNEAHRG